MGEYYAVERSSDYLAHYGVRGMKWGIRKAIDRIHSNVRMSKNYMKARKKLGMATAVGGIVGGSAYAATHRSEIKKAKTTAVKAASDSPQRSKISTNFQKSREYMDSHRGTQKKLMARQAIGGLAGSAIYAATHKNEFKSKSTNKRNIGRASATKSSASLKRTALDAGRKADEAYKNLSFLGKRGFGKTAKNYRNANSAAREATTAYYNSLSKKQYAKLRRKHIG